MSETKKTENNSEKQQVKGVLYEEDKMQQVINILNSIPVNGLNNVKAMGFVFDVLANPIPFKNIEEEK